MFFNIEPSDPVLNMIADLLVPLAACTYLMAVCPFVPVMVFGFVSRTESVILQTPLPERSTALPSASSAAWSATVSSVAPSQTSAPVLGAAATVHEAVVYEPLSTPLVHMRVWEEHVCPLATLDDWYAVTDALCATDWPLKVHEVLVDVATVQELYA